MAVAKNNTKTFKNISSSGISVRLFLLCITLGLVTGVAFFVYGNLLQDWDQHYHSLYLTGCLMGGVVFGLLNYFLFAKLYLRNMRDIVEVIDAVGAGDLSAQCKVGTDLNDVVGRMAFSVNRMSSNLRNNISSIAESTYKVSKAVSQLSGDEATQHSGAQKAMHQRFSGRNDGRSNHSGNAQNNQYGNQKNGFVDRRINSRKPPQGNGVPVGKAQNPIKARPQNDLIQAAAKAEPNNATPNNATPNNATPNNATPNNAAPSKPTRVEASPHTGLQKSAVQKGSVSKSALKNKPASGKNAPEKNKVQPGVAGEKVLVEEEKSKQQRLDQESREIAKVLDVIQDIALQTNLLALNASIDAAKAGEQGRGFAVVAEEVGALALRTQKSTLEIKQMIDRLQSSHSDVAKIMDTAVDNAKRRMNTGDKVNKSRSSNSSRQSGEAPQKLPGNPTANMDATATKTSQMIERRGALPRKASQNHREINRLVDELRKAISLFKR
jgi:methyl-accepting chemotaxis protein